MKNKFLAMTCLFASVSLTSFSQTYENGILTTSTGYQIKKGDKVKIGVGTMTDGSFKYIRVNSGSLFKTYSAQGNVFNKQANEANSFPREYSGLSFEVKKIMDKGSKKNGYVYYAKINKSLIAYEIDVENAVNSGELDVPEQYQPKKKPTEVKVVDTQKTEDIADKIKKLKDLKDQGVLSDDEFQEAKKKLIENMGK